MSIIERTEEVPATTRTTFDTVCDLCGRNNDCTNAHVGEHDWDSKAEHGRSAYERVVVQRTHVEIGYEMDGSNEGEAWDFCPVCFDEKVRPLLLTLAQPRKVNTSW